MYILLTIFSNRLKTFLFDADKQLRILDTYM